MELHLDDSATAARTALARRSGRAFPLALAIAALFPSGCSVVAQHAADRVSMPVGTAYRLTAPSVSPDRPLASPDPVSPAHGEVGRVTEPGGLPDGYAPEGYVSPDWAYSGYVEPPRSPPCDESSGARCDDADAASAADAR